MKKLAEVLAQLEYLSKGDQVVLRRVWGVGTTVCKWDDETENSAYPVPFREVLEVIRAEDQWFYDVDVSLPHGQFRFGVFDSSFAYLEGPDEMVQSVGEFFPEEKSLSGTLPFSE